MLSEQYFEIAHHCAHLGPITQIAWYRYVFLRLIFNEVQSFAEQAFFIRGKKIAGVFDYHFSKALSSIDWSRRAEMKCPLFCEKAIHFTLKKYIYRPIYCEII